MYKFCKSTQGLTVLIAALVIMVCAPMAQAQDIANGSATATVLAALTVTAGTLVFGSVYQGVSKAITNDNAAAGVFSITGASGAGVSMYMQLPDYVSITGDSDRMVISFSATDCNIDTAGVSSGDPTAFLAANGYADDNPHNLPTTNFDAASSIEIFLGGTVLPTIDQTAGAYTGDIILTVAYDGT